MGLTEFVTAQLAGAAPDPEDRKLLAALEQFAAAALEGGVRHRWDDWASFTDLERRAWVSAGRMLAGHDPASSVPTAEEHDEAVAEAFALGFAHGP